MSIVGESLMMIEDEETNTKKIKQNYLELQLQRNK